MKPSAKRENRYSDNPLMGTRVTEMSGYDALPLSKFFRMAVVAGVESAVQIHIDRGDDLNARDDRGQTPLMLSAARNKVAICKLLLAAGADADLLDPSGRSALRIAQDEGAHEAACMLQVASPGGDDFDKPAHVSLDEQWEKDSNDLASGHIVASTLKQPASIPDLVATAAPSIAWQSGDEGDRFDLTGWEAEGEQPPPDDDSTLSAAAFEIQCAITKHQPIDTSADWDDFEAFLPNRAMPLPRAEDAEARERLRLVLLRAIREGSVPHSAIVDLTLGDNGEADPEAGALLGMVINDLGAETDERFEYSAPHESFEVFVRPDENLGEEAAIAEALAFLDNLAVCRNEPLRIYQREFQREALLTAQAEVALGQLMELSVEKALDALAAWPTGIRIVLEAAQKVASGAKPLRWISSGPPVEPDDSELAPSVELATETDAELELPVEAKSLGADDEDDSQFGLDPKESTCDLVKFCADAEFLSGLAAGVSHDAPEWNACRGALASLGLTRDFLMKLADFGLSDESKSALAFAQAMKAYRRARDQMAVSNLKLVFSIAKKYLFSGQPLDDLLQEGNIGLLKAVDRYNWRRGFKFSTYATWWIRQQVGRFLADKGKTIRLPVYVYAKIQRVAQATHDFELRHGHAPTNEEIATLAELPVHKVVALARAALEPFPLYDLHAIDDLIAADAKDQYTARDPMDIVEEMQLIGSVDRLLGTLKLKEENVLRMRFGIGIQEPMTLEEVGARLNVTRERIRQIEADALRRLKHPARLDRLLREFNGAPSPQRAKQVKASSYPKDDTTTVIADNDPLPFTPTVKSTQTPERLNGSESSSLDELIARARAIGFEVEDYLEGESRRIWVYIKETPDNHSRKIVRKLIDLGFEFWPGKGYWR